jgi:hypothetical protein
LTTDLSQVTKLEITQTIVGATTGMGLLLISWELAWMTEETPVMAGRCIDRYQFF